MNTKNVDAAIRALRAELAAPPTLTDDELGSYLDKISEAVSAAQALRGPHKAAIARLASAKSRAKKAAEIEALRARVAELDG